MSDLKFKSIGVVKTPYVDTAPYQPIEGEDQQFYLELEPAFVAGLRSLESFTYIYVEPVSVSAFHADPSHKICNY